MSLTSGVRERLLSHLQRLYNDRAPQCLERISRLAAAYSHLAERRTDGLWDQRDAVLIAYGDQVRDDRHPPLGALQSFLLDHQWDQAINGVHILPFCPYSSDDGFSVIDYRQVDPDLGSWDDVAALGRRFDLMFDLVLNHCSAKSEWFRSYLAETPPYDGYFIEADPAADLSGVTRPRSLPLLTEFESPTGPRHVWTTFSPDQVDLNFSNPDVLCEMLDVLLTYVDRGARIIRLDAIAYLWKRIGTACIHLPETHAVVKVMRLLLDAVAPGTLLLTETNVPHTENVSYFGEADEAHMVYQFSLAPLLLDAFLTGDAGPAMQWLSGLDQTPPGTTFFNFTASHDGIGVRPLEGLVSERRLERLVEAVQQRGGRVSTRRNPDGSDSPYELNVTYFSALADPDLPVEQQVRRFLASQAVMLALRGIPGIYFHSLVATPNDLAGVEHTGRARSINRRKFERRELERLLQDERAVQRRVFDGYRRMLDVRIRQPAFHPEAFQKAFEPGHPAVIAFARESRDGGQRIVSLTNTSGQPATVDGVDTGPSATDLLSGRIPPRQQMQITLEPYQTIWLCNSPA